MRQLQLTIPARPATTLMVVDPAELSGWIAARIARPVRITVTDNRSTMVSCKDEHGVLRVRLHRIFLGAEVTVLEALAGYLGRSDPAAGKIIDAFIAARLVRAPTPPAALKSRGRFHDLAGIWTELNATYFHDASCARITWGAASSRRYRRTIQLGCYVAEEGLIRIHPSLDQAFVPRPYVAGIVFHEMLHEVFGVERHRGRRSVHPPEFMAIEQSHPDYRACKAWEEQNIHRLLRYRGP